MSTTGVKWRGEGTFYICYPESNVSKSFPVLTFYDPLPFSALSSLSLLQLRKQVRIP